MGDSIADSVTDGFGRIHDTTNCYCAGPPLFPSVGSPNPMLTGVALARRTADFLSRRLKSVKPSNSVLPSPSLFVGDGAGWQVLDGLVEYHSANGRAWPAYRNPERASLGLRYVDGQILTIGGGDHAVFWYTPESFSNFV